MNTLSKSAKESAKESAIYRIRRPSDNALYLGMKLTEENFDDAVKFIGPKSEAFLSFIPVGNWLLKDRTDSLLLVSPEIFVTESYYIDDDPIYWEIYELTPVGGNNPKMILRATLPQEPEDTHGYGSVVIDMTKADWFNNTATYIMRRNDGYTTSMNSLYAEL